MRSFRRSGLLLCAVVSMVVAMGCGSSDGSPGVPDATTSMPKVDEEPFEPPDLIPLPRRVAGEAGHLHLTRETRIAADGATESIARWLAGVLRSPTALPLEVTDSEPRAGDIVLTVDDAIGTSDETYELRVGADGITVRGASPAGVFYGAQTFRQLLPPEAGGEEPAEGVTWRVPMVEIDDHPRFEWRGVMLDVARHFFSVDVVKRLIDRAAYYKINRLHLHLTDDQGWRVQVDSWPRLTTIGGATAVGGGPGGFFTKADVATIVEHGAERFVVVIPEVDMPGHTNAALASYAELNESGTAAEPFTSVAVGFSSLWVGGPETDRFVADVVREVAEQFPGPYFHVGGDEAIETSEADYVTFVQGVRREVEANGKTLVGWEEVAKAELEPPFVAQQWLNPQRAVDAAALGGKVIASPAGNAYLDMKYDDSTPIGLTWAGTVDVERAYSWDPVIDGLREEDVLGVEAPLWTETVQTEADIELLVFPRLLGHAEIAWSASEGRTFDGYVKRLAGHGPRLRAMGVEFHRSPLVAWE